MTRVDKSNGALDGADDADSIYSGKIVPPIINPADAFHRMTIHRVKRRVCVKIGDCVLANSSCALAVKEIGQRAYPPVIYFPLDSVASEVLVQTAKATRCPLKGETAYFDFEQGAIKVSGIAWSYLKVLDFDPNLHLIENLIAFDSTKVEFIFDAVNPKT